MNNLVKIIVKLRNDKNAVKFNVWATSIDEAISKVTEAEKAPKSAVIYARVSPLSIYDIKRLSEENGTYYFTRKTMRFFGQTLASFSVSRFGDDKFYICAPAPCGTKSERIFNPFTKELEIVAKN